MKLWVLVPAYKCGETIGEVCSRVKLPGPDDEIIVVDDGSPDDTFERARAVPRVLAYRNLTNLGYGGTSRRLYELALERGADLVINIHGDLGHRPEDIPLILEPFEQLRAPDMVVGSRLLYLIGEAERVGWWTVLAGRQRRGGMPVERVLGHLLLTWVQNRVYGSRLHSFHEGMRACRREVVEWITKSDFPAGYAYDNELIYQAHRRGLVIQEVP